jgi:hypothetical protein
MMIFFRLLTDHLVIIAVLQIVLEVLHTHIGRTLAVHKPIHILVEVFGLVLLVMLDLGHIVVKELQNQEAYLVVRRTVDGIDEFAAYGRQLEVEEEGVAVAQISQ